MAANFNLQSAIVQILHSKTGAIVGTGFVAREDAIVTCAHVVEAGDYRPGESARLTFHVNNEEGQAEILANVWQTAKEDDIAILRLEGRLPTQATILQLSESTGCAGHYFRAFGYTQLGDVKGTWATGKIEGMVRQTNERPLLQLTSAELDKGISGGPVVDLSRQRAVGMVTSVYYPDINLKHRDTALAIPADSIHLIYPSIPLHPQPIRELFESDGRPFGTRFLNKQIWADLLAHLKAAMMARPGRAAVGLLALLMVVFLTARGIDAYTKRNWRSISGGDVLLGTADNSCPATVEPFTIQITEVTNADYQECVDRGKCAPQKSYWEAGPTGWTYPAGLENHPVFNLAWEDAQTYCQFIEARLPTEAEWVRAARGGTDRTYPWGAAFDTDKANVFESGLRDTVEVTSYEDGRTDQGLYHMSGNVREWVADGAIDACDPTQGTGVRVARGGGYLDSFNNATLWVRAQGNDLPFVGVRCVRDK